MTLEVEAEAPWWKLLSVVVASLAAGLFLISLTFGEGRSADADATLGDSASEAGETDQANSAESERTSAASGTLEPARRDETARENGTEAGTQTEAGAQPEPVDSETPEPATGARPPAPALPDAPSVGVMRRGRIAYLRCGDLADSRGRCPRDREFESLAWQTMTDVIPRCGLGHGWGEVRFVVSENATLVEGHDFERPKLDEDDMAACLAPYAAPLTSSLEGEFILSIRFSL